MNELSLFNSTMNDAQSIDKEQSVKALSSSNNLNNASKREKAELAQSLPSGSIMGVANNAVNDEVGVCDAELDLADFKYDYRTGNPAVYVSSYHRYNCGSLDGMWIDLSLCGDYEEFMRVCRQVVWDEEDPEFMFQDMDNFPEAWYDEGSLNEDTFERIQEFAALDEDEREAFEAFMDVRCDPNVSFEEFHEAYQGEWNSEEEFTEQLVDDLGILDEIPEHLRQFFDMEAYSRALFESDYDYTDGYVFRVM